MHCKEVVIDPPSSLLFLILTASAKTLSGLLEWECKTDAVEALTVLNHYQIRVPSKSVLLILLLSLFFFHVVIVFVQSKALAAQYAARNGIIFITCLVCV